MAVKLTLTDISTGYQGTDIQANFTDIEDEFDKVVYRDGSLAMSGNLDMNSQRLVNLPAPTSSTEPLRKDDLFTSAEAQSFASDAETAKDAAETALFNFQDHWLGPSATDPTQDGNGNALEEGDLYFDTTNDVLKTYDGASWVNSSTQFLPNVDANVTATEDELNVLDGITASTAELNILDGATVTTAELNRLDGPQGQAYDLSSPAGSGFTGGTVSVQRLDKVVTMATINVMSHASASSVDSDVLLDSEYRPIADIHVVTTANGDGTQMLTVTSGGNVQLEYRDWSGTARNETAPNRFTVSYVVS